MKRVFQTAVLLGLMLPAWGCPQLGNDPVAVLFGGPPAAPAGYVAVVFLNRSTRLVQPIVALSYPRRAPLVWVNSVAPGSWDSLVVDAGLAQLALVGIVPVELTSGLAGDRIDYGGKPLESGKHIVGGSVVVIETQDAPAGSAVPVVTQVRTIPEGSALDGLNRQLRTSPTAPGSESGLVLIRPEGVAGLKTVATVSWEDADGLVYVADFRLAGAGVSTAALIECPVERVGWGNLARPEAPGARLGDEELPVGAPAPLREGVEFWCGDAIRLRAEGDASRPEETVLLIEATREGAEVGPGQLDLFGNIRRLLDETGFAGKLSNARALLPAPGVGGEAF